ncbi:MAG TPA: hypothetical protein VHF69_04735 [Candidatus Synoicihabitans sp.]|nr:hypothetical protein [Candidatus Synoicihabitans sp.]
MKTPARASPFTRLFVLGLITALGAAAQPAPAASDLAADGSHFLFMGTDVSVEWKNDFYPVRGVRGQSFLIRVRDREVEVPMNKDGVKIRVNQSLRLTRTTGLVDKFASGRAYTAANDPQRKFQDRAHVAMALADASVNADRAAQAAVREVSLTEQMARDGTGGARPDEQRMMEEKAAQAQLLENLRLSDGGNLGSYADQAQAELARESFDALEISCNVSVESPLRDPYLIVIARYQEPGAKPGVVRDWIYAEALNDLSRRPARVRILRGGFKPGYHLQNVHVHVYDQGREIATNLSRNRVALTAEEAFKYLLLEYLAENKDATVAARSIPELWPHDEIAGLSSEQISRPYYIKVGNDGLPVGSFTDAAHSTSPAAQIADLIAQMRFYPALQNGKPAESTISLRLSTPP